MGLHAVKYSQEYQHFCALFIYFKFLIIPENPQHGHMDEHCVVSIRLLNLKEARKSSSQILICKV